MLPRLLLLILLWPLTSAAEVWPDPEWPTTIPEAAGIDRALLEQARDYALSGAGSGYVIHRGYLVFSWGDPATLYDVKSVTKSIGVTALGLALGDALLTLGESGLREGRRARGPVPARDAPHDADGPVAGATGARAAAVLSAPPRGFARPLHETPSYARGDRAGGASEPLHRPVEIARKRGEAMPI